MELDLSALTKLGSTVNDVHIDQEIRMPAVWRESEKKWEVTLPATFNISRLYTIGAAYLSDGTSRVDVHGQKFYDENGILRFSIYSNQIKKFMDRVAFWFALSTIITKQIVRHFIYGEMLAKLESQPTKCLPGWMM